ncbi:MAG: hypothetical protein DRN15_08515 [Thermoprotei archaeon]|nr:MAG: hypothetical protein DRN15_08515 [Thermoprotei archaeon]RLF25777.1 MAG: hypothetical protein DRM97_00735 [Thermoprotei archaeon]
MQPFARLPSVPKSSRELINIAIGRGRKIQIGFSEKTPIMVRIRKREALRIKTIGEYVRNRLREICFGYPRLDEIHPFLS